MQGSQSHQRLITSEKIPPLEQYTISKKQEWTPQKCALVSVAQQEDEEERPFFKV
ncbi:hypothetical protein Sjap_026682 [Stephania japonica]|uniref:Uncharacterized protein n=1 Tax=Stephania japonica TaxID=461633 RepID=A0AAP0DXS4_9MAGN